jgi:hypothetical protein
MRARIAEELTLLREYYEDVAHVEHGGEDWFQVPRYAFPPGWALSGVPASHGIIIFKVGAGHPTAAPYGFATEASITFNGATPNNISPLATPFPGNWVIFSWSPDGSWQPTGDVRKGSNLLVWIRSFAKRLEEGV